jgi:uncharacterized protein (DUF1501 family)
MNRRKFFKRSLPAAVTLPGLLNGFSVSAFASAADDPLTSLLSTAASNDHILVLIQLQGGNDGLNMVIPLDMYANYYNARTNVAIPQSKVLRLNGTDESGLHPAMTELQSLYNNGKAAIVQSVGYGTQNYSHFRSTDIWMTGDTNYNKSTREKTGWLGRYLESEYPGYPEMYPSGDMPDPLAIQISAFPTVEVQGNVFSMGLSITDPNEIYRFVNPFSDYPFPEAPANTALKYVRMISEKTKTYSDIIRTAYLGSNNLALYPENELAHQLKIVSRLIQGGLKTRVYTVTLPGFDTHKKQVNASDTTTGAHAKLMKDVSSSIAAFQQDLELMGLDDRVLGMTFSEFGRRIKSNASMGTDHGAAAPLFMFGKHVKNGVLGKSPEIPAEVQTVNNIAFQYDFRSVYATVLERWFCVKQPLLDTLLLDHYQSLPLIDGGPCGLSESIDENNDKSDALLLKVWPNPYSDRATIQFSTTGGFTMIQQINAMGQVVKMITKQDYQPGTYTISVYDESLPVGQYFFRLQNKSYQKVVNVIKTR